MSLYTDQVKNTKVINGWKNVRCKCGSTRIEARIAGDDDGEFKWLELICKKCNHMLFYNGA